MAVLYNGISTKALDSLFSKCIRCSLQKKKNSLDFVSGNLELRGFELLTWTSNFHCFGALGVSPGARTWPQWHMCWAWHLVIIAIVEPLSINSKVPATAWPLFFLELSNILENNGLHWGFFFNTHPLNFAAWPRYYNYFTSTKTSFVEFVSAWFPLWENSSKKWDI